MPNSDHLEWLEIADFTPGLWTRNRSQMPYNAAQAMVDAYPLKGGGMRPFYDDISVTTTNLDLSAGNRIIGIGQHVINGLRDMYVVKYDDSDNEVRLYRMDETAGASSWTLLADSFDTTGADTWTQAFFETFIDAAGVRWMLMALNYGGTSASTGRGIWKIAFTNGAVTLVKSAQPTGLIVNQGRWMYSEANTPRLYYSEVGSIESTENFLDVTPSGPGADITALSSQEPSDILIGKSGASWVSIQGDISSPNTVVRELVGTHPAGPRPLKPQPAPGGMVFVDGLGSVYLTDGRNFQDLGETISSPHVVRIAGGSSESKIVAMTAFAKDFLFVGGGLVKDMVTGAWFTISQPDSDNKDLWLPDYSSNSVWGASLEDAADATMVRFRMYDSSATDRAPSCSWTSAPFTTREGGDARIREVEIWWETRAATANDITVTRFNQDGGGSVARSVLNQTANLRQRNRFKFPNSGSSHQYITVAWNTSGEDTEAALINRIRIGLAPARNLG